MVDYGRRPAGGVDASLGSPAPELCFSYTSGVPDAPAEAGSDVIGERAPMAPVAPIGSQRWPEDNQAQRDDPYGRREDRP
jgi:hypothetical protein